MPIAVTKYRCAFKCGRRASESKKMIEEHEVICWNNPINRTCKSCKYERYYTEIEDYGPEFGVVKRYKIRDCLHPQGDCITDSLYESLKIDDLHIKPRTYCPFWVQK